RPHRQAMAAKKRKSKRYIEADPEQRGLYVRIPPDGPIVFAAVARDPYGKQVWATLGTTADLKINEARERAREAIRRIKDGQEAIEAPKPKPESVAEMAENWLRRHVEKNKHRTAAEMRRQVEKYILPYWRDRIFVEINRADVTALLDMIEDKHGPAMADAILTTLRSIGGWVQKRHDDYIPPLSGGCAAFRRKCAIARECYRTTRSGVSGRPLRKWVSSAPSFGYYF